MNLNIFLIVVALVRQKPIFGTYSCILIILIYHLQIFGPTWSYLLLPFFSFSFFLY